MSNSDGSTSEFLEKLRKAKPGKVFNVDQEFPELAETLQEAPPPPRKRGRGKATQELEQLREELEALKRANQALRSTLMEERRVSADVLGQLRRILSQNPQLSAQVRIPRRQ